MSEVECRHSRQELDDSLLFQKHRGNEQMQPLGQTREKFDDFGTV